MGRLGRLVASLLVVSVCITGALAGQWHVSPAGSPDQLGTQEQPFSSLSQARDAIRRYRQQNPDRQESHTVIVHAGEYRMEGPLVLGPEDSGSANAPITYRVAEGEQVILTTGVRVPTDLFREPDSRELTYLNPKARGHVIVADLAGTSMAKAFPGGSETSQTSQDQLIAGAFSGGHGKYGMLTWNEYTLQLARWPNRGFVHLDKVIDMGPTLRWLKAGEKEPEYSFDKPIGGKFTTVEKTDFAAWGRELQRTQDIRQDGYLSTDWTKDANQVARVSQDGVIQLLDSTRYGIGGVRYRGGFANPNDKPKFAPNRRLYFENILCELDMPGEWYYDRKEQKLYLWPIDPDIEQARIMIPGGPVMVRIQDAQHIILRGFIFEGGGELGLSIEGGNDVTIASCIFRNFIGRGARVVGGSRHGFNACDFYNLHNALTIDGGDLRNLIRADHYIENCDFHHIRLRGYGGVGLSGCGIRFTNNIYHDTNAGITYSGAYIDFVNNEFFNVGWEMGDWNVLYQGASKFCNGNRVENNFFHHMMEEPTRYPVMAARNDDGGTGTTYQSNIFYKTGRGAIAFGGPNSHIRDNIVLDCPLIWWTSHMPSTPEQVKAAFDEIARHFESGRYPRGGKEDVIYNVEQVVGPQGWNRPPWSEAFPVFARYMNENPFAQSYGSMLNNYSDQVREDDPYAVVHIHPNWSLLEEDQPRIKPTMEDLPDTFEYNAPMKISMDDFVDPARLNFRLKPGFQPIPGFRACDLDKVGLYQSVYRPHPPNPDTYRSALYQRYRDTPSTGGRYDQATAYLRYPIQPWMIE